MMTPFSFVFHEYLDSRPLSACNEWCPECSLSPKFKRVSLNKTFEFPFWGVNICVDFDLRDSKKMENMKKLNKTIFHVTKILISTKLPKPHS